MFVCFIISVVIRLWYGAKFLQSAARHEEIEHLKKIIHDVSVEIHKDIEYWYDANNHHFLASGATIDEVVLTLKSRFPEHIFLVPGRGGVAAKTGWKLVDDMELTRSLLTKETI
jgi:hypothetical protein